jgi:hypothetical protein
LIVTDTFGPYADAVWPLGGGTSIEPSVTV